MNVEFYNIKRALHLLNFAENCACNVQVISKSTEHAINLNCWPIVVVAGRCWRYHRIGSNGSGNCNHVQARQRYAHGNMRNSGTCQTENPWPMNRPAKFCTIENFCDLIWRTWSSWNWLSGVARHTVEIFAHVFILHLTLQTRQINCFA
jgi:hypothetical protein